MRAFLLSLGVALLLCTSSNAQYCDPPGEFVGTAYYPVQSLGSSTNRISIDSEGWISVVWMQGMYVEPPRYVYHNYRNADGQWLVEGGSNIGGENGDGFPSAALLLDNRLAIAYHNPNPYEGTHVKVALDLGRGFGIFEHHDVPDALPNGNVCQWPQIAVSANGDVHILMREYRELGTDGFLIYTRSEDGGSSWTNPVRVDSVSGLSGRITAAADGKVAIVYTRPTSWEGHYGYKNDVCYFSSLDGREWDFSEPINITDYENDDLDIYCPWGIDAAFDLEGYLNAVWLTIHVDEDGRPVNDVTELRHYSERTGETSLASEMTDPDVTCNMPGLQIDKPTMSINSQGDIEIIFTGYVDTDVSSDGDCVGDLYMVFGTDYGGTWFGPFNITATHSPGCLPGHCQSESQQSTAETMADSVYLTYIKQRFGDVQYPPDTVYYMPVAVPYWVGMDDFENIPAAFHLKGNYPNPFNSRTLIEFETVEPVDAGLRIYDISGALVETLYKGRLESGLHTVVWNGDSYASGVYFCRLSVGSEYQIERMLLLK